ncbi:hypothetical protein H1R20_g8202, partial [Candolleomyces eurysporus]
MDPSDVRPDDDTARFFIWHEWLQANGPLTPENVFDYFTNSMFYDAQCNNAILRMQTRLSGTIIENEEEELRRFKGVEFVVVDAQPPTYFIIQKRDRISPDEAKPLAAYYCVQNRIYQAPDLYSLLSNRILASLFSLQTSLDILRNHRPDYTPRTGFVWPIVGDPNPAVAGADASKKKNQEAEETTSSDSEQPGSASAVKRPGEGSKRMNMMLLMNAMHTTAMNSVITPPETAAGSAAVAESVTAETPSTAPTPAPQPLDGIGRAPSMQAESSKTSVKKKRKRSSVAPPPSG